MNRRGGAALAAVALLLGACAGPTAADEPRSAASCVGPQIRLDGAMTADVAPGDDVTVTGELFYSTCDDVGPGFDERTPYGALTLTAVVDGARFDVGTVTPDAEGSWSVAWHVPEGAVGSAAIEADDGRWAISLDTSGAHLVGD
ncbi:hypothetical protein [Sanguibacter sp. HDW7]|uniref:hypothetical protein n=1 Tax=Sanguibacter sp. HDW7 TaxID=2714931 RepID=UPI00140C54D6|nr:hypothetical protein [Sanguibacter sp. HDW7]QIK82228.1 hypothetical protein G7063_00265 [Sanguibacter sp. HDW7]